jgi:hypothetical protein
VRNAFVDYTGIVQAVSRKDVWGCMGGVVWDTALFLFVCFQEAIRASSARVVQLLLWVSGNQSGLSPRRPPNWTDDSTYVLYCWSRTNRKVGNRVGLVQGLGSGLIPTGGMSVVGHFGRWTCALEIANQPAFGGSTDVVR